MTKIEKVANLRQKRFRDLFLMNAANRPAKRRLQKGAVVFCVLPWRVHTF